MADFCYECFVEMFSGHEGIDPSKNDFAGISTKEDTEANMFPVVLCEGCGAIQVDHEGYCVSDDCDGYHRKPRNVC